MMIAFEIARFKSDRFAKIFHVIFGFALRKHESKRITGATYVLVSFALCILLFPPLIAFWAMAFLSIGDTFAAIIGISFGKIKFPRSSRTLEGSLACLITTFAFAKLTIPASADRNYLLIIILGSITATIAEVLNIRFDDNITIPIFSGIVMTLAYFFL
jgi:dolichol kinase